MGMAILSYATDINEQTLDDFALAKAYAESKGIHIPQHAGLGKVHMELFEAVAEKQLIQPTFVTEHPSEVSPLARANDNDSFITDRAELYIAGYEIANMFSELNDPEDQAERFKKQLEAKEQGDDETMAYDADYIQALECGLPLTAGEGIGIDRLVMLLTDSPSIREVILFPLLRHK